MWEMKEVMVINAGTNKTMEVKKGNEEASKSINKKLSDYTEPARQRCIYRVQNHYLRDANDNVHEPRAVALGPYHRGKQGLKMMEEHKLRYLKSLLLRKKESVDAYISAAAEIEEEARSYYAEDLSYLSSAKFIEMLVLDACFIIELVSKYGSSVSASDPIFQMEWILVILKNDLILFENQILFFVLCKLFDLVHDEHNQHWKLIDLIASFLKIAKLYHSKGMMSTKPEEVRHLLHLTHAIVRPSSPIYIRLNKCPPERESRLIPSATELRDANVTFRKRDVSMMPFEVDFSDGVLTMPPLTIDDETDVLLRNLILYEQYFPDGRATYVTDYVMLLDFLVNTRRDVEILSQCRIVKNMTGDNQVAADIINRLAQFAMVSQTYFIYGDMFSRINAHYGRPWNRARASLNRDDFNTPWAYISFVAALLLLLLTLAQTVFSALQVI